MSIGSFSINAAYVFDKDQGKFVPLVENRIFEGYVSTLVHYGASYENGVISIRHTLSQSRWTETIDGSIYHQASSQTELTINQHTNIRRGAERALDNVPLEGSKRLHEIENSPVFGMSLARRKELLDKISQLSEEQNENDDAESGWKVNAFNDWLASVETE